MSDIAAPLETRAKSAISGYLPGLVLVAMITASVYGLRHIPFVSQLSPMISAIFVGMLFANVVGTNKSAALGISISGKKLLRLAVALLGVQISFAQLGDLGIRGVGLAAFALGSTFLFTIWMGRLLGVDRNLAQLLAAGTSICGASAIAATNATIGADDEDVSYAVACITLFGTLAMFLFPLAMLTTGLTGKSYGLWIGLSVHEVAQVVGAGFQGGNEAGEIAVVTKLARVMMLAPLVIALSVVRSKVSGGAKSTSRAPLVPHFVVGFLILAALNSFGVVPNSVRTPIVTATPILLTAAMAALGLRTSVSKLKKHGLPPLLLAGLASLFIASTTYALVTLTL